MTFIKRMDHVGITVSDLDAATAFFVALGLQAGPKSPIQGEFLDTVIGASGAATEIVMLHAPDGGATVELSSFTRPDHLPGAPSAPAHELGLRSVAFEVNDVRAAVESAAEIGHGLVGGIGDYEGAWRMAYVRGPDGIIVSLAENLEK